MNAGIIHCDAFMNIVVWFAEPDTRQREGSMGSWLRDFPWNADQWLLESVFEKFTRWWQKTVLHKHDCFWWARAMIPGYTISAILMVFFLENMAEKVFIIVSLLGFVPMSYLFVKDKERRAYEALRKGALNPEKVNFLAKLLRIFETSLYIGCVGFLIMRGFFYATGNPPANELSAILAFAFSTVVVLFMSALVYLVACDPLPPGTEKSRLEQWFASLREEHGYAPAPVRFSSASP